MKESSYRIIPKNKDGSFEKNLTRFIWVCSARHKAGEVIFDYPRKNAVLKVDVPILAHIFLNPDINS